MLRSISTLSLAFFATLAVAQNGMLGTKGESATQFTPSASSGGGLLQMVLAVIVVMVLMKLFLPKMMAKYGSKLSTGLNSAIKVEESASFAGGSIHLVTVRGRTLLLGSTPTTISTLADLGEAPKNDPGPTFMEMVEAAPEREFPTPPSMDQMRAAISVAEENEAAIALQRLNQLMR
ncbi:MAG: flagellar biosynthetic protein FliO [Fimbriimonas sp.]|jgi:flagellar biogenesis protein FliO|nr:flagellar biosynthetic protein FliO [Fimbriimonas sp.]